MNNVIKNQYKHVKLMVYIQISASRQIFIQKKGKNILSGISYTVGNAGQFTMTSLFAYNCLNKYLITSIFLENKVE